MKSKNWVSTPAINYDGEERNKEEKVASKLGARKPRPTPEDSILAARTWSFLAGDRRWIVIEGWERGRGAVEAAKELSRRSRPGPRGTRRAPGHMALTDAMRSAFSQLKRLILNR